MTRFEIAISENQRRLLALAARNLSFNMNVPAYDRDELRLLADMLGLDLDPTAMNDFTA